RPRVAVLPPARRKLLAVRFGRKSSWTIARWTRVRTSAETAGSSLITRETVLRLTPARAATSRIVGLGRPGSEESNDKVVIRAMRQSLIDPAPFAQGNSRKGLTPDPQPSI